MNFNGVFDEWNYMNQEEVNKMTRKEIEVSVRDFALNHIKRLSKSEVDESKAWVYKPQFMDYVARGMRNFLKSPFKS